MFLIPQIDVPKDAFSLIAFIVENIVDIPMVFGELKMVDNRLFVNN